MQEQVTIEAGERITTYTSTFPARRYWYRHDLVKLDGRVIGRIQTRERFGRVDVMTTHDKSATCVIGKDTDWLVRLEAQGAEVRP